MELNISLKDEQKEFLDQIVNDYSLEGIEETIQLLVKQILSEYDNENVFGEIRCVGECFSNENFIKLEMEDQLVTVMKDIFSEYDFEDYDSEEEELGKVIRSIINFVDQECDLNKIFSD